MSRRLLAALLVLAAAAGCAPRATVPGAGRAAGQCRATAPGPGELLGPLRVSPFPSGEAWDMGEARGSVVLLDVWATWCEPCRDTLPSYEDFARELGPKGLKVWALNVDEDPRQVAAFLEETGLSLPILLDAGAQQAECRLGLRGVPTSFLIDRAGRVRYVHQGASEDTLEETHRQLQALLAEPSDG